MNLYVMTSLESFHAASDDEVIAEALRRLRQKHVRARKLLSSPTAVKDWLALELTDKDREVFRVLYVDSQNRLIEWHDEFTGTLNQTSVYPREIVKRAVTLGAAAVFLVHNHPSGVKEPSGADRMLTDTLRAALNHIDCKVLDHFIVAGGEVFSFSEKGML